MSPILPDQQLQAYTGNRYVDPWARMEPLIELLLAALAFPALTLLVFLRPKLGYRVAKPWILVGVFLHLLWLALMLNFTLWGYTWVRDHTGLGEFIDQTKLQYLASPAEREAYQKAQRAIQEDEKKRRDALQTRLQAEARTAQTTELPDGYDARLPDNYRQMPFQQQQQWYREHRITDSQQVQQLRRDRQQRDQQRQQQAQQAQQELIKQFEAEKQARYVATHPPFRPHWSLFLFGVAVLVMGLVRRREARKLIPDDWHTCSRGESYTARVIPGVSEYAIQAFIEPLFVVLLAVLYWPASISLSLWLMFAAFTVCVSEVLVMEVAINRVLDQHDGEVEGRLMQRARQLLKRDAKNQHVKDTKGVRGVAFADDIFDALGIDKPKKDDDPESGAAPVLA